jgi:hypothetical protein
LVGSAPGAPPVVGGLSTLLQHPMRNFGFDVRGILDIV